MAEQLVNEFTVNRPIDEAWAVITDVERIAPCLPGAQLQEIEGDVYRGVVKVKLGAIAPEFKGQAPFIERDDSGHSAMLKAEGRDTGGRGNAAAEIVADAESLSPDEHECTVTTDLHITGKVAQFGRGIIGDVSKKLMDAVRRQPQHDARRAADRRLGRRAAATGSDDGADRRAGRPTRPLPPPTRRHAGRAGGDPGAEAPRSARSTARPPSPSTSPASPARPSLKRARTARRRAAAAVLHRAPPAVKRRSTVTEAAADRRPRSVAGCSGASRSAPTRSSCATRRATRSSSATRHCSTTARRCRRGTGWSARRGARRSAGSSPPAGSTGRGRGRPGRAGRRPRPLRRRARRVDPRPTTTGRARAGGVGGTRTGREVPPRPLGLAPGRRRRPGRPVGRRRSSPARLDIDDRRRRRRRARRDVRRRDGRAIAASGRRR